MSTTDCGIFLAGKKVNLRPIRREEIALYARWMNDPSVRVFLLTAFPKTIEDEAKWFERMSISSKSDVVLIMETKKGVPIGILGIHGIDWINRHATTGTCIGEKAYWGKGYGTDAKMTLLDYCFNTLGLNRISSQVMAFNERSVRYSLGCGYRIEGRRREHYFRNGSFVDCVELGVLRAEWLPVWKRYQKTGRKR